MRSPFAIVAVCALALVSRLLPDVVNLRSFPHLPGWEVRLSYPLGYWNGLGIFLALVSPLLLRTAAGASRHWIRGLSLSAFPALAAAIYLTSSRGAAVTAAVALGAFAVLTAGSWRILWVLSLAAAASTAGVLAVSSRLALVDGPLGSASAVAEGHRAAIVICVLCAVTGLIHGIGTEQLDRRVRLPRRGAQGLVIAAFVGLLVVAAVSHPVARFQTFRQVPDLTHTSLQQHLLSAGGSGRWQYWAAAVSEFTHHPIVGGGAGSWGAWWAQHGSVALIAHDAHSLYLETLAELGVVGLVLPAGGIAYRPRVRRRKDISRPRRASSYDGGSDRGLRCLSRW